MVLLRKQIGIILISTGDFMNTKLKNVLSALTITSCLLVANDGFAKNKTGNGDGYSGPTLDAQAIAVNMDKKIKQSQVFAIAKACAEIPGKDNFLVQIGKPLFQVSKYNTGSQLVVSGYDSSNELVLTMEGLHTSYIDKTLGKIEKMSAVIDSGELRFQHSTPHHAAGKLRNFKAPSFPKFVYTKKAFTPIFDSITGDLIKEDYTYENFRVLYDFQNYPAYPVLTNITTRQETALVAPAAEFTQCIIDGLGRL